MFKKLVVIIFFILSACSFSVCAAGNVTVGSRHAFASQMIRDLSCSPEDYSDLGNEKLNFLCDRILEIILTDETLSQAEQAEKIYQWIEANLSYTSKPQPDLWQDGAYDTLMSYSGDCFGYYASLRALLQRAGIRCLEASSIPKDHYWVMAQVDHHWRHLDATPGWGAPRFLLTTEELLNYCYEDNPKYEEGLIYEFDCRKYPVTH